MLNNEGTVTTANSVPNLSYRLVEKADVSRKASGPLSMIESSMMIDKNNRFIEESDKRAIETGMRYDAISQLDLNFSISSVCSDSSKQLDWLDT